MKKFKLLSLALAFCMIASLIPAPVASAADGDVLYPMIVDFAGGTGEKLTTGSTNLPTVSANGFAVDFSNSGANAITWNSTGFNLRLVSTNATAQYVTFNVKAPAGEYAVFVEGLNQTIDITVGNENAVTVSGTTGVDKIVDSVVLDNTGSVNIKFQNYTRASYNVIFSKIIFIPVGTVNMNFCMPEYAGGGPWNTTIQSPFWSYEKNGAEYVSATGAIPVANSKFTDTNFNHRGKVGSTLSFKFLVPDDGEYTATLLAGQVPSTGKSASNSGNWKITIDDTDMGTHSYWSEEVNHNLGDIELTAGEHTLTFECTSLNITEGSTWSDSNNYLIGFTLTPVVEEEPEKAVIPESDIFGDVYAYVEDDTLYFIGGIEKDAIDGYAEVGFEVKVDGEEADDINTTQVYTSFTIGSDTYKATEKFGSEYVFITKLENVGDASSVTVSPYVKDADGVKTFHVDDANNALALTLNLK